MPATNQPKQRAELFTSSLNKQRRAPKYVPCPDQNKSTKGHCPDACHSVKIKSMDPSFQDIRSREAALLRARRLYKKGLSSLFHFHKHTLTSKTMQLPSVPRTRQHTLCRERALGKCSSGAMLTSFRMECPAAAPARIFKP